MSNRSLAIYLAITYAAAFALQGAAVLLDVKGNGWFLLGLTMWAPLLAGLVASKVSRAQVIAGVRRAGWRYWPVGLVVGWSFSGLAQLLLAATGTGHWNVERFPLTPGGAIAGVKGLAMMLGTGEQAPAAFAINALVTVTVGALVMMLAGGLGEEAGWRGVLQPELARRFGVVRGTVLVGLVWGFWHLPANLAGYNGAEHALVGAFVFFPATTIAMSFAYAWLTDRSGSVWPAALAHAANNVLNSGEFVVADGWAAGKTASLVVNAVVAVGFAWMLLARRPTATTSPAAG